MIRINERMKELGLKGNEVAKMCNLSSVTLVDLRRGTSRVTFATIQRVCAALRCTPNDITYVDGKSLKGGRMLPADTSQQ